MEALFMFVAAALIVIGASVSHAKKRAKDPSCELRISLKTHAWRFLEWASSSTLLALGFAVLFELSVWFFVGILISMFIFTMLLVNMLSQAVFLPLFKKKFEQ